MSVEVEAARQWVLDRNADEGAGPELFERGVDALIAAVRAQYSDEVADLLSYAFDQAAAMEASRQEVEVLRAHADMLARAIDLTQQYVGTETLSALPGWSWFDALEAHRALATEEEVSE